MEAHQPDAPRSPLAPPGSRLPWNDRRGRLSPIRAGALIVALAPTANMAWGVASGAYMPDLAAGLLYWTGVWATALLLATLGVTPLRVVLRRNELTAARRILGLASLAYTLAHVVAYAALDHWSLAQMLGEMSALSVNIVAAVVATCGLIALGATSSDSAIQKLGSQNWRRLHGVVHLLASLSVLHYLLARQPFSTAFLCAGVLIWLLSWRGLQARGRGRNPGSLAAVALLSAAGTALLEAGSLWIRERAPPAETLAFNVDFSAGPSPAVQVLLLGMGIAVLAGAAARTSAH